MISPTLQLPSTVHRVLSAPTQLVGAGWERTRALARTVAPCTEPDDERTDGVEPPDWDTGELLLEAQRPLGETGDPSRAARARRLARVYLERRQKQLRAELDDHR